MTSPDTKPILDPGPILQTAFGFTSSKVLLTAVEFDLFTKLGARRVTGQELGKELGLHPRGIADFYEKFAIPAESFARMVAFAIGQPDEVDVNEILFRPTAQEL